MPDNKSNVKNEKVEDKSQKDTVRKAVFSWSAPEFITYKRDINWYLKIVLFAVIIAGLLAWQEIWTGVALVIVAAILLILLSQSHPKVVKCALYYDGVVVDDKVFRFDQFKSFWIIPGELPKAKLQYTGKMAGQVTLPIKEVDPEQVRLFLSKHLAEESDKGEDLTDTINRLIKF